MDEGDQSTQAVAPVDDDNIVQLRMASRLLQSIAPDGDGGIKLAFADGDDEGGMRLKPPAKESIYRVITSAERPKYKLPARYTLFYLKFANAHVQVGQYDRDYRVGGQLAQIPLDRTVIKELTKNLVTEIRNGTANADAENFKDILFTARRLIIFFIDNRGFEFHKNGAKEFDSIEFVVKKLNNNYDKNHSFFDGGDISFAPADGPEFAGFSATYMFNYLKKNVSGDDCDEFKNNYCFEAYVRMPFANGTGHDGKPLTIVIDPTGGNQGPPPDP